MSAKRPSKQTARSKPGRPSSAKRQAEPGEFLIPHEKIAARAYAIWCKRGCPAGADQQLWIEAEAELRAEMAAKRSGAGGGLGDLFRSLAKDLADKDAELRARALNKLSFFGVDAKPLLLAVVKALNDEVLDIRRAAMECLLEISPSARSLPRFPNLLASEQEELRLAAIRELVMGLPDVREAIASHQVDWEAFAAMNLPELNDAAADGANGLLTHGMNPSVHLIRVPDREARKRAFGVLIRMEESWVRLPGNLIGLSTRQVAALKNHDISFDWVSKIPTDA